MKPKTETKLVQAIRKRLEADGFRVIKLHGNAFQEPGLPDLFAIRGGRLLAIEVKLPGNVPTPIQRRKLADLEQAGAVVGVATSIEDVDNLVARFEQARYNANPARIAHA
jgi:Holliday junction resolvase